MPSSFLAASSTHSMVSGMRSEARSEVISEATSERVLSCAAALASSTITSLLSVSWVPLPTKHGGSLSYSVGRVVLEEDTSILTQVVHCSKDHHRRHKVLLFTLVRGRGILRTSALRRSP